MTPLKSDPKIGSSKKYRYGTRGPSKAEIAEKKAAKAAAAAEEKKRLRKQKMEEEAMNADGEQEEDAEVDLDDLFADTPTT